MKRILIPTDFSRHSDHAVKFVLSLLKDTQIPCSLLLLNTYMIHQTDPLQVLTENDRLKNLSKEGLEKQRQAALKEIANSNLIIETASHLGSLSNIILQLLGRREIDLVVMGKDGGRHVEHVSKVLKNEQCPLLITYLQ